MDKVRLLNANSADPDAPPVFLVGDIFDTPGLFQCFSEIFGRKLTEMEQPVRLLVLYIPPGARNNASGEPDNMASLGADLAAVLNTPIPNRRSDGRFYSQGHCGIDVIAYSFGVHLTVSAMAYQRKHGGQKINYFGAIDAPVPQSDRLDIFVLVKVLEYLLSNFSIETRSILSFLSEHGVSDIDEEHGASSKPLSVLESDEGEAIPLISKTLEAKYRGTDIPPNLAETRGVFKPILDKLDAMESALLSCPSARRDTKNYSSEMNAIKDSRKKVLFLRSRLFALTEWVSKPLEGGSSQCEQDFGLVATADTVKAKHLGHVVLYLTGIGERLAALREQHPSEEDFLVACHSDDIATAGWSNSNFTLDVREILGDPAQPERVHETVMTEPALGETYRLHHGFSYVNDIAKDYASNSTDILDKIRLLNVDTADPDTPPVFLVGDIFDTPDLFYAFSKQFQSQIRDISQPEPLLVVYVMPGARKHASIESDDIHLLGKDLAVVLNTPIPNPIRDGRFYPQGGHGTNVIAYSFGAYVTVAAMAYQRKWGGQRINNLAVIDAHVLQGDRLNISFVTRTLEHFIAKFLDETRPVLTYLLECRGRNSFEESGSFLGSGISHHPFSVLETVGAETTPVISKSIEAKFRGVGPVPNKDDIKDIFDWFLEKIKIIRPGTSARAASWIQTLQELKKKVMLLQYRMDMLSNWVSKPSDGGPSQCEQDFGLVTGDDNDSVKEKEFGHVALYLTGIGERLAALREQHKDENEFLAASRSDPIATAGWSNGNFTLDVCEILGDPKQPERTHETALTENALEATFELHRGFPYVNDMSIDQDRVAAEGLDTIARLLLTDDGRYLKLLAERISVIEKKAAETKVECADASAVGVPKDGHDTLTLVARRAFLERGLRGLIQSGDATTASTVAASDTSPTASEVTQVTNLRG